MSQFVALTLDPAVDAAVRTVWEALAGSGINRVMVDSNCPPHLTLGSGLVTDGEALSDALAGFASSATPFPLTLSSVGVFQSEQGVMFYGVTVTRPLLELHAAFDRLFARHARRPNAYYRVGTWVPHCTLAIGLGPAQQAPASDVVRQFSLPLIGRACELILGEAENTHCRIDSTWTLGGPETA